MYIRTIIEGEHTCTLLYIHVNLVLVVVFIQQGNELTLLSLTYSFLWFCARIENNIMHNRTNPQGQERTIIS